MKIKFNVSSFRNVSFCYEDELDLEDYMSKETYLDMSSAEKEYAINEIVMEEILNNYVSYGWEVSE